MWCRLRRLPGPSLRPLRRMRSTAMERINICNYEAEGLPIFPAYVAGHMGAPAVIVIQEWWGVTDTIKAHALRIADAGYRVLVPDIYRGKQGVNVEEAHHLMSALDFPMAVKEISQAAGYLKALELSPKVGVTGFCMGGALAMAGLSASNDVACAAPFYGLNFDLFDAAKIRTKPLQYHSGALDTLANFSDPAMGARLAAELTEAGHMSFEVFLYPGVGHAFMNESPAPHASFEARQAAQGEGFPPYSEEQAELAWGRLLAFFDANLK